MLHPNPSSGSCGGTHQLPTCGTGIPPTHHALSHEGFPKGIPLLPLSGAVGQLLTQPRGAAAASPGQGLWVTAQVSSAAHLEHPERLWLSALPGDTQSAKQSKVLGAVRGSSFSQGPHVENEGCVVHQ